MELTRGLAPGTAPTAALALDSWRTAFGAGSSRFVEAGAARGAAGAARRTGAGAASPPNEMDEAPPGGARTRVDGRSVMKLSQFIVEDVGRTGGMGGKLKWYGHWGLLGVWVSDFPQAQQSPQTVEQHSTNGWNGDDQMKNCTF